MDDMMIAPDCVFCKIVTGDIPSLRVQESAHWVAFLDIAPLAEGHTLVIPKQHHSRLHDLSPLQVQQLAEALPRLAGAIQEVLQASGYNILQNNGIAAGQQVDHVHFHIIPRHEGDGLGFRWLAGKYAEGRAELIQQQLAAQLS